VKPVVVESTALTAFTGLQDLQDSQDCWAPETLAPINSLNDGNFLGTAPQQSCSSCKSCPAVSAVRELQPEGADQLLGLSQRPATSYQRPAPIMPRAQRKEEILGSELPPTLPLMALRSTIVYPLGTIAVQMGAPENLAIVRDNEGPGLI